MSDPRFAELLEKYWAVAYQQGKEGRNHDDANGTAEYAELMLHQYVDRLTRELAQARAEALEEAANEASAAVMKFRSKVNGRYYPGYHEDMRDDLRAAIRTLKASP